MGGLFGKRRTTMAIVKWMKGIEFVSGLLSKRPKKGAPHSEHSNALLATHRVAPTSNPDCTRIYAVGEYSRSTQPSAKELALRERFTEVRAMVATRRKDLNKISQDQLDFIAQKDLATGKKTMTAYLWKVCGEEYDEAHNG